MALSGMEIVMGQGRLLGRLKIKASRFQAAERGIVLVEFALILPVMILIFFGLVEFGEAFSVNRKVANAASSVADLVSQQGVVSTADLDDITTVATQILQPYRAAPLTLRIVSVAADENNVTTVAWTYPSGGPAVGSAYALPASGSGLTEANSSVIVTEAAYAFTPTVGQFLGSFQINGRAYFRPRLSRVVTKTD